MPQLHFLQLSEQESLITAVIQWLKSDYPSMVAIASSLAKSGWGTNWLEAGQSSFGSNLLKVLRWTASDIL